MIFTNEDPPPFEFADKLLSSETIFRRVLQKRPVEPAVQRLLCDFLEKNLPPGFRTRATSATAASKPARGG